MALHPVGTTAFYHQDTKNGLMTLCLCNGRALYAVRVGGRAGP